MVEVANQSNITCQYILSEEQEIFHQTFSWWLYVVVSLFIGFGGLIVNSVAILVMLKSELAACFFYWLLICLEFFDNCFLLCCILDVFRKYIGSSSLHNYIFAVFLFPFKSVVMLCSIYIAIALSIERYGALVKPISHQTARTTNALKEHLMHHGKRLLKFVGSIILFSVCFYIPRFFEVIGPQ